jgi:hypothetical protein
MLRHWQSGKRDGDFHTAVRDEFPFVSLERYNAAADAAWAQICRQNSSAFTV